MTTAQGMEQNKITSQVLLMFLNVLSTRHRVPHSVCVSCVCVWCACVCVCACIYICTCMKITVSGDVGNGCDPLRLHRGPLWLHCDSTGVQQPNVHRSSDPNIKV